MSERPIIITGFMAIGKTTVAKALARKLNCRTIDLDFIITERERQSIPALINEQGEAHFRAAETRALEVVLKNKRARVISLGGGAWTIEQNRALISEHNGFTVWLDAPFEFCWRRILHSHTERPLATDRETARRLYETRRPIYALAQLRVEVGARKSSQDAAMEIIQALNKEVS